MGGHHLLPSILTWHGRSWQVGQLVTPCACRSMSPKATSSPWMQSWRTQPAGRWRWAELSHDAWRPLAPVPPGTRHSPMKPRLSPVFATAPMLGYPPRYSSSFRSSPWNFPCGHKRVGTTSSTLTPPDSPPS